MLSKLFSSARYLFNPILQVENYEEPQIEDTNTEMVTTRGQHGKNAASQGSEGLDGSGEDATVFDVPRSSRKRSRKATDEDEMEEVEGEVEKTPKKQKILPLREKDEDKPSKNTRVVVEIPVSSIPEELQDVKGGVESDQHEDAESGEEESSDVEGEEEATQLEIADSGSESVDESEAPKEPTGPSPALPKKQTKPSSSFKISESTTMAAQPKYKRFGSEEPEPEPELFSTAKEIIESDEESSDDDAPEVLGAQDALRSAQSKARDTAKVVEEQESVIRKKRQDRAALLKRQAETASKKRKRAEEVENKSQRETKLEDTKMDDEPEGTHVVQDTNTKTPIPAVNRSDLPDLLPDEYLQDESESEDVIDPQTDVRKKPKKMKFADLVEKKPKDRRKGLTTYRVSEVCDKNLAPKSSFHARSTKEAWLKGRAGSSGGGGRKVVSGRFFKKK